MATISRPDPTDYTDAPWTDQNGQRWLADSKGRWSIYVDPPEAGGGGTWGGITGTLSAQTDLQTALNGKAGLATDNTFSGNQTFNESATFNQPVGVNSDLVLGGSLQFLDSLTSVTFQSTDVQETVQNALFNATGTANALRVNVGTAGAFIVNGGAGGTPSSITLTNATSLPAAELTGNVAAARIATALAGGTLPFSGTTGTFSGAVTATATTLASNSTTGAVLIGNGSASTNVAIGGGTVYAGNRLVFTSSLNDASGRFGIAEGTGHSTLTAYNSLTLLTTVGSGRLKVENSLTTITGNLSVTADVILAKTITAPATTGARTINQSSGRVNFAAAATSLVVTNSLCTANSIVHCTVATNDTTMRGALAVAGAGSFTIYADTAPTAETAVNFILTN